MESGYLSVCDRDKVNIYDGITATITVSEEAVLKGWQIPHTNLCNITLRSQVTQLSMHTLLLNGPMVREYIISLYTVLMSELELNHIEIFNTYHVVEGGNNNV